MTETSTINNATEVQATDTAASIYPRDITVPLRLLYRSQGNVRKTLVPASIPPLAAMIKSAGLLMPLLITADGEGRYAVEAGGRRLAAMHLLVREGHLTWETPIGCRLFESSVAVSVSLMENAGQERMHPADEYEAFAQLVADGKSVGQVAGMFGITPLTVERRLALGLLEPRFLDLYRAGKVNPDQLRALTLAGSHALQVAVWDSLPEHHRTPYMLKEALLGSDVRGDADEVQFVGLDTYEAAGGQIRRDLFGESVDCWLTDRPLLNRLVSEKLEALAATERADGWNWVEAHMRVDAALLRGLEPQRPKMRKLSEEEAEGWEEWLAMLDAAKAEVGLAQEAWMECVPGASNEVELERRGEEAEERWKQLEEAVAVMREDMQEWSDKQKATCGVLLTVGHGGIVKVQRGMLRAADRKASAKKADAAEVPESTTEGTVGRASERADFSERLMYDLTSHRTAAIQALLTDNAHVALALVVERLAAPLFCEGYFGNDGPLKISPTLTRYSKLSSQATGYADCEAARVLDDVQRRWGDRVPGERAALFGWLLQQDQATLLGLLAFCAAHSLDAMHGRERSEFQPSDALANALDLDMVDFWQPTPENFLSSVSKAQLIEAVTEAAGAEDAKPMHGMKKGDAVTYAVAKLKDKSWLPRPLRRKEAQQV